MGLLLQLLITKKAKRISLGIYLNVKLSRAYEIWHEYENLISKNIDPKDYREEKEQTLLSLNKNIFKHFAWEYFDSLEQIQKSNTLIRKKGRIKLLCDYIGDQPIKDITAPKMLEVLLDIQKQLA